MDKIKRVMRAKEEKVSMRRVERQFLSMAVVMLLLVGAVLAVNTVIIYTVNIFYHDAEVYFHCLQVRVQAFLIFLSYATAMRSWLLMYTW